MNKEQWKAINDFCEDCGYFASEVLYNLKFNGTIGRFDTFDDLSKYPKNDTYEAMYVFLTDNLN